jgi:hypothetical protein
VARRQLCRSAKAYHRSRSEDGANHPDATEYVLLTPYYGPSLADAPLTYPTADRSPVDLKPDGRREAATGDGVAVPVAEWIAHRILLITGD